jgi:hypothetical protein
MPLNLDITALDIAAFQDQLTLRWHDEAIETWHPLADPFSSLVARQHLANFELWHTEDAARTPNATDADLARVKRHIDETNQRRNDLSEQVDRFLLAHLAAKGLPNPDAELNSESPGLIIDRLSILALKTYHTREETTRTDASSAHIERNQQRLAILLEQRSDLAACLHRLWTQTLAGTRRFKLYQQLKMYNDPSLNPAVYRKSEDVSLA